MLDLGGFRQLTGDQLQAGVQAQERLGALRMTAEKDEDENVRQAARDSVRMVQDAIKGRFGATAEAAGEERRQRRHRRRRPWRLDRSTPAGYSQAQEAVRSHL